MDMRHRRIDPEPITIFLAGLAVYSAALSSLNYAKSHGKPLPSAVRSRILNDINKIDSLVYEIRQDLSTIRQLFERSDFPSERVVRLGNGAYLSYDDFNVYRSVTTGIFRNLGRAHRLCLKLESDARKYGGLDMKTPTNELGSAYEIFETLRLSRNLTVSDAWSGLDKLANLVQVACGRIRSQLQ